MSYDPSATSGLRAIQVDMDGGSIVSDDISIHSSTNFKSSSLYFIDQRYFVTTASSSVGLIFYSSMTGFSFMGGITRCNAVTGLATITDNRFCGANTRNVTLTNIETRDGSGSSIAYSIKSYWRIS